MALLTHSALATKEVRNLVALSARPVRLIVGALEIHLHCRFDKPVASRTFPTVEHKEEFIREFIELTLRRFFRCLHLLDLSA